MYHQLAHSHHFPFQAQPWWLDAVCGPKGWGAAIAFDNDGAAIGAMPYGKMGWKGFPFIRMPPFTASFFIWMQDQGAKRIVRQGHWEHKILNDLISELPPAWLVDQQYHPALLNGLPWHAKGFQLFQRYTYQISPELSPQEVWTGMESATRNLIRKGKNLTITTRDGALDELFDLIQLGFRQQGNKVPFSFEQLQVIDALLAERSMRTIYAAHDAEGRTHASCYVVWDGYTAHGLLSGAHPEWRKSGAFYAILWRAIKDTLRQNMTFDFEGSMIPPIERVFRSFGARRVPYLRVVRYQNRLLAAAAALLGKNR